eukprot:scaffold215714_cov35-Tisochrysis_lutea.AAC.1
MRHLYIQIPPALHMAVRQRRAQARREMAAQAPRPPLASWLASSRHSDATAPSAKPLPLAASERKVLLVARCYRPMQCRKMALFPHPPCCGRGEIASLGSPALLLISFPQIEPS